LKTVLSADGEITWHAVEVAANVPVEVKSAMAVTSSAAIAAFCAIFVE
jgi:acetamidase/formamidase